LKINLRNYSTKTKKIFKTKQNRNCLYYLQEEVKDSTKLVELKIMIYRLILLINF